MPDDSLEPKLRAFAASAKPPKQQPAAAAPLDAVGLATRGERIVLLDIGRTSPGRVPTSGPDRSQHDTIAEAALKYVQAHFPGTGCSPKGGGSSPEDVIVFCFPPTAEGLRGYNWFHAQGKECAMPIPDSDITVRIPMKAWVAQPGAVRTQQVFLTLRNVPSELWIDGLAAELLKHYDLPCDVKSEYAPAYHRKGTTYHGILHRGCIKAELAPAPGCDLGKLPTAVRLGGRLVQLRVYGYGARPQGRPPRPPSPPPPAQGTDDPGSDPAASRRQRRNQRRNRNRVAARARAAQGGAAGVSTTDMPPPAAAGLADPVEAAPPPPPSPALATSVAAASVVEVAPAIQVHEAIQPAVTPGSAAVQESTHVASDLVARTSSPSHPPRATTHEPAALHGSDAMAAPEHAAGASKPRAPSSTRPTGNAERHNREAGATVLGVPSSPGTAADAGPYVGALVGRPSPSAPKSPPSPGRSKAGARGQAPRPAQLSSPRTAQPRDRDAAWTRVSPKRTAKPSPRRGAKDTPLGRARLPSTPHKAGSVTDPIVSPNRFTALDDIDDTQDDTGPGHKEESTAVTDGRRASARIALLPPKSYKDCGPIPPMDSSACAAEAPILGFV